MRPNEIWLECETLKDQIVVKNEINWANRLKLEKLLEQVLLTDVEYGLSKQIEQTLWNSCFKNCVDLYQSKLRNFGRKENIRSNNGESNENTESSSGGDSALLSMFLKSSVCYFTQLMYKLCTDYSLNVNDIIKSDNFLGLLDGHFNKRRCGSVNSLNYILQFCLIHLGDVSRYQKRMDEAESYYLNAVKVCPTNGHAFNQLAILETGRGQYLSAVYFYTRSLYIETPFLLAATNLEKFFLSIDAKKLDNTAANLSTGTSSTMLIDTFHRFIASIHLSSSNLDLSETKYLRFLCKNLKPAYESGSISHHDLLHMFVITVGSIWRINSSRNIDESSLLSWNKLTVDTSDSSFYSVDEKRSLLLLIEFVQKFSINVLELALTAENSTLFHDILKLIFDWFRMNVDLLKFNHFCKNSQFLRFLCEFLNFIQQQNDVINKKLVKIAEENLRTSLPIDKEFFGFLPFEAIQKNLNFQSPSTESSNLQLIEQLKIFSFVEFGHFITNFLNDERLITCISKNDPETMNDNKKICPVSVFSSDVSSAPVNENEKDAGDIEENRNEKIEKSGDYPTKVSTNESLLTKSSSKRQTKVLPLLTIIDKGKHKSSDTTSVDSSKKDTTSKEKHSSNNKKVPTSEPPKIKIAPSGSKVDMPLASEKKKLGDEDEEGSGDEDGNASVASNKSSSQGDKSNQQRQGGDKSTNYEYELPPRFQAAKLKHALGSVLGVTDNRPPSAGSGLVVTSKLNDFKPPSFNLSAFPPLTIPPPSAQQTSPIPAAATFSRTPGVRPPSFGGPGGMAAPPFLPPPPGSAMTGPHRPFNMPLPPPPRADFFRPPPPPLAAHQMAPLSFDPRTGAQCAVTSRANYTPPPPPSSIWPPQNPMFLPPQNSDDRYFNLWQDHDGTGMPSASAAVIDSSLSRSNFIESGRPSFAAPPCRPPPLPPVPFSTPYFSGLAQPSSGSAIYYNNSSRFGVPQQVRMNFTADPQQQHPRQNSLEFDTIYSNGENNSAMNNNNSNTASYSLWPSNDGE